MKIFFNDKSYDDLKNLQETYLRFIHSREKPESFKFKITYDNNNPIMDFILPVDRKEQNIFVYIHKILNKELIDHIEDIFYVRTLEENIKYLEDCYVEWYTQENNMKSSELACLKVYSNDLRDYYEYPSSNELLYMATECALYDKENFSTDKNLDKLTEEYLNISTESLIDQYEKYYHTDYHATLLAYIGQSYKDKTIQEISLKRYDTYNDVKKHYNANRKTLEFSITKKKR